MDKQRAISDEDKATRRAVILDAALNCFYLQGFKASKMDDIAKQAGVSKGTLYLYFQSKEDIFQAVIDTVALEKMNAISQLFNSPLSLADTLGALFQFAEKMIRHSNLPKVIKVLISDAFAFPTITQHYQRNIIEPLLTHLTERLTRAADEGEISIVTPELTARLVVAPILLSMIWKIVFEPNADKKVDINALLSTHHRYLLKALELPSC